MLSLKHELEYVLIWVTRSRCVECGVVGEWKDQQLEDAGIPFD